MDIKEKLSKERDKLEKQTENSTSLCSNKILKQSQKVDKLIVSDMKKIMSVEKI